MELSTREVSALAKERETLINVIAQTPSMTFAATKRLSEIHTTLAAHDEALKYRKAYNELKNETNLS